MAASSWDPRQPRIVGPEGGIAPIYKFKEGSTQSYKAGTLVAAAASTGLIAAFATSGTAITGIAMEDASGTASTAAHVQIIRPGDRVQFTCYDVSDGAETSASNFVAGATYDIEVVSGVCYAEHDSVHATTEELIFVQPVYDVNGDSTTEGIFMIEGAALTFHKG